MFTIISRLIFATAFILMPFAARGETVLRLNELQSDSGPEGVALHMFKSSVESATKGRVQVKLHFENGRGNPAMSVENIMSGDLDIFSSDLRFYLPLIIDEVTGLDLPFMVLNNTAATHYLASPLFDEGRDKVLTLRGVRFLELEAFRGPRRMMALTRRVSTVDDLSGLKLAIFPAPTKSGVQLWHALGVEIVEVAPAEVAAAIDRHRIDGVISTDLASLQKSGALKIANFVMPIQEHPQIWQISINEAVWKKFGPEEQAALSNAAKDAASAYSRVVDEQSQKAITSLDPSRIKLLPALDSASVHQRLMPVYDQLIAAGATTARVRDAADAANSASVAAQSSSQQ